MTETSGNETLTTPVEDSPTGRGNGESTNQPKVGKLTVRLLVDANQVAESTDPGLWQDVLAAITGHRPLAGGRSGGRSDKDKADMSESEDEGEHGLTSSGVKFAKLIGATPEQLAAACSPTEEAPFLTLDHHSWDALKQNTPARGIAAIPPIVAAGTILALWFRELKKGFPTIEQAQVALDSLGQRDKNPRRGLQNREWLQLRDDDQIVIKPTKVEEAKRFVRQFCTHAWGDE